MKELAIINKIKDENVRNTTVSKDTDLTGVVTVDKLMDYMVNYDTDSLFYTDTTIEGIIEYLSQEGIVSGDVAEMSVSRYGRRLFITYYEDLEVYMLELEK